MPYEVKTVKCLDVNRFDILKKRPFFANYWYGSILSSDFSDRKPPMQCMQWKGISWWWRSISIISIPSCLHASCLLENKILLAKPQKLFIIKDNPSCVVTWHRLAQSIRVHIKDTDIVPFWSRVYSRFGFTMRKTAPNRRIGRDLPQIYSEFEEPAILKRLAQELIV